jgi:hypothetical protein
MDRRERQHGQSTVEFGLSAVVLLLILFGLIDLGRAFYFGVGLQSATREGARQGTWFDGSAKTNPYLDDTDIKAAVDGVLGHSGLPSSVLQNPGATCPTTADANGEFNPPFVDSTYQPSSLNQPLLYICYAATPGLDLGSAPAGNGYKGSDLDVILVMSFGFGSGFLEGPLGSSIPMAANTHMTIGGY